MSVDFFDCDVCGRSICDCGDYVSCECGKNWCSEECAESDGYERISCKLGYDVDDNECEDSCCCCDNQVEDSCKYCREEDFEDDVLLEFALKLSDLTREELIEAYKLLKNKKED